VYRVTDSYGAEIGRTTDDSERILVPLQAEEKMYIETDGSMIFTREEGWKEVKVGRIFKSGDCIRNDGKPGCITHSQYMAHLGDCKAFRERMEDLIDAYGASAEQLVFISDGAIWIKKWIEDAYSGAISMLDYFHAAEHLYEFVNAYFKDKEQGKLWGKQQEGLLLKGKVKKVIKNIETLAGEENDAAGKLTDYYRTNQDRMDYPRYKKIGCGIIGSGAIESAHRTVVQKRMKQSGQRWTRKGAQNMLNLRVTYMNEQWCKIIHLAKTEFSAIAS
ncbi:MAG: UPF0236 family transposase-like protein, partial [Candidatus Saccharimonadales bacterium]